MIVPTQAPAASKLDAASRLAGGRLALLASLAAIVVLDLGLPDLDGREVVAGLRDWFKCPILTVSLANPTCPGRGDQRQLHPAGRGPCPHGIRTESSGSIPAHFA
jgi:CheY-like chemotaxis protein